MFLTFFTTPKAKQISFDDILNNPYLRLEMIPDTPQKKVTVECSEEYGQTLYNKKYKGTFLPDMSWVDDINPDEEYKHFTAKKKSGKGYRDIYAPSERLKAAQRIYKHYIEETLHVQNHKCAHAYTKKRSNVTNAEAHKNNESKWAITIDFSNFFDSINEEWLKTMLLKVYPFKYIPEEHLDRMIRIALYEKRTPQGSVLSPTLTNIVMVPIDHEIYETLVNYNRHHYVYTRYADDIAVTCKEKFDPQEIIGVMQKVFDKYQTPFKIKDEKTKFMSAGYGAIRICGVNITYDKSKNRTQLSAGHKKNDKFRAMINNFCVAGEHWELTDINKMLGLMSYYRSFEKPFVEKTIQKYNEKYNIDIMKKAKQLLNGTYSYVKGIEITTPIIDDITDPVIPF